MAPERRTDRFYVPAIARAREAALVPGNGPNGSPQHAILAAAQIAFGRAGQTESEKRRDRTTAHELAEAGVTADEFGRLVAEYRRRGWPNPSLSAIAKQLSSLRAPWEPGRKAEGNGRPAAYDALAEVYADLDPRRQQLEAG